MLSFFIIHFTDPTKPPSNITAYDVSSNAMKIRWSLPPCGYRGGEIVKYSYSLINTADKNFVEKGSTTYEDITFKDLSPYRIYIFRIAARTNAGAGPVDEITERTNEGGKVKNLFEIMM